MANCFTWKELCAKYDVFHNSFPQYVDDVLLDSLSVKLSTTSNLSVRKNLLRFQNEFENIKLFKIFFSNIFCL